MKQKNQPAIVKTKIVEPDEKKVEDTPAEDCPISETNARIAVLKKDIVDIERYKEIGEYFMITRVSKADILLNQKRDELKKLI